MMFRDDVNGYVPLSVLEDTLVMLLAGRAAEFVVSGPESVSPGGANDLEMATELAGKIEMTFGLGALGLMSLGSRPVVDAMLLMPELREAVRRRLDANFRRAVALIEADRDTLAAVVEAFIPRRYLTGDEIRAIVARHDAEKAAGAEAEAIPLPPTRSREAGR